MERIKKADLVLCDLSVPRKDIFVEYGVAISANKPVIQCVSKKQKTTGFPQWIMNLQNQFFDGSSEELENFFTSISVFLEQDLKKGWKRDSQGRNIEAAPDLKKIFILGTDKYSETFDKIFSLAKQVNLNIELETLNIDNDNLEKIIKGTRSAGTLMI